MPAVLIPAAIDALIIAVMGALVIWALFPVIRGLVSSFPSLPVVGNVFARVATQVANTTVAVLSSWANAGLAPLTDLVNAFAWRFYFWRQSVLGASVATVQALWRVRWQVLPALETRVLDYANGVWAAANTYAYVLAVQAHLELVSEIARTLDYAQGLYRASLAYAAQLYAQAVVLAQAVYAQAIDYALSLERQAIAYADALYQAAIRYAQIVLATALGFAEDAFGRAIDYERQLYGEGIKFTEAARVWARDYADARIGALAAAVAVSIDAVAVRVLRIERSKCQRFCNPLGDLGEVLQDLQGLGVAALFLSLAAEMARDPQASARALDGALGPLLKDVSGAIRSEAGVR